MKRASLAVMLSLLSLHTLGATADDIRGLMEQKQFAEAYQLGKQHANELGTPAFDFFFGIAAIDSNAPGEGVLALERYLTQFPDNRSARFHLARGYYVLGEDALARTFFNDLLEEADSQERDGINKFLDAIRARESRYTPTAAFFAEAGFGHDSNINGGIRAGQIAGLPAGMVINPGTTQEKERDTFQTLNIGAQGTYPVAPGIALYGGAQASGRWNGSQANDIFDQRTVNIQGGISILKNRDLFRIGTEYALIDVDRQSYLGISSLIGEWNHQYDQFNRLTLGLQWSQLRYDNITIFSDKQKASPLNSQASLRDSNLYMANLAWTHAFVSPMNPVLTLTANIGQERNSQNRHDLSRDILGGRAALTLQPMPKWSTSLALTYQNSRYDNAFSSDATSRRDHFYGSEFAVTYALDRNWSIRGEYIYTNQQSNIGFYDYDRHVVAAKVRYDFK
ncbi:outer membrane beta-barrel protein [Dechloromonas sp. ZS-1]|uniref:outer membrane beta-barrel protein n=1 Tax=Dechloromonas sp. ZS-1 TaxID=3138067 RepID=UPI0031FC7A30